MRFFLGRKPRIYGHTQFCLSALVDEVVRLILPCTLSQIHVGISS
jgi:hypothetical protein